MKNFPRNRGVVAGVLKSTFGLSASILTTVYTGFFSPHTTPFLLFLGLFICTVALLSLWCVQRRGGGLLHRAAVLLAALAHAYHTVTRLYRCRFIVLVPLEERLALDAGSHARVLMGYGIVVAIAAYLAVTAVISSELHSRDTSSVCAQRLGAASRGGLARGEGEIVCVTVVGTGLRGRHGAARVLHHADWRGRKVLARAARSDERRWC